MVRRERGEDPESEIRRWLEEQGQINDGADTPDARRAAEVAE
jgi:hypothetical protein